MGDALRPGSILDSHDELQIAEMINVSRLAKIAYENDVQVMVEGPGHVLLNEVSANVRLAKCLIGEVPIMFLDHLLQILYQDVIISQVLLEPQFLHPKGLICCVI